MDNRNLELEAEQFGMMLEPIATFAEDKEVKDAFMNKSILKAAALIFKKHPSEAVDFICAYEGTTRETTDMNKKNMLQKLINIFSDKDILSAFTSAE